MTPAIPDGYEPLDVGSAYMRTVAAFWRRIDERGVRVGLRVQDHQVNANGTAHGGLIATLADVAISVAILHGGGAEPPSTINLTLDFAGPARVGQWLEARPEIYKRTLRMAFAHCMVFADEGLVARSSGIFRVRARA
ncbi:MAG: PaaI family thioesterase [Solimonas sp.]